MNLFGANSLRGQEVQKNERPTPSFSVMEKIPSFSFNNSNIKKNSTVIEWFTIQYHAARLGYLTKDYQSDIALTSYQDLVFAGQWNVFEPEYGSKVSPIDQNPYLSGTITVVPYYGFTLSAHYRPESGNFGNKTAGMAIRYETGKTTFNAEYMGSIHYEEDCYSNNGGHKEYAWLGTLDYQLRKPIQLAIRYEAFSDDTPNGYEESLTDRISIGGRITLFTKGPLNTNLMAEYRKTTF